MNNTSELEETVERLEKMYREAQEDIAKLHEEIVGKKKGPEDAREILRVIRGGAA